MKQSTTIEEQIEIMKKRGIIFSNENKSKENLLDIGYFRLGFYCFPFEKTHPNKNNRTHEYIDNTSFDDIIGLYYFDVDLRNILYRYISRIEINIRTYLIYTISNFYINNPIWFVDKRVVLNEYANRFNSYVYTDKFKDISVIKCHHRHHPNDIYAPAWKTIEFMTFGAIIRLFKNLKDVQLKRNIARHYNYNSIKSFENNLEAILLIRNSCAHGNVLFDINIPKPIKDGPAGTMGYNKSNLVGAIAIIKYFMGIISQNRLNDLDKQLGELLSDSRKSENVNNIIKKCSGLNF